MSQWLNHFVGRCAVGAVSRVVHTHENVRARAGLALLVGMLLALSVCGQGEETPAPAAAPAENLRDPFWPLDYVRPVIPGAHSDGESAAKISEAEWRSAEKILRGMVKGVSRVPARSGKEEYLAVINDKVVAVGAPVSLSSNGKLYRWKVAKITVPGGPVFERLLSLPPTK